jgi:hypothetical protein
MDKITNYQFPQAQHTTLPQLYSGSCSDCAKKVENTVHAILNRLDYDGLIPHLQTQTEIARGKSLDEITLTFDNEEVASTCVGMSSLIQQHLQNGEFGFAPALASQRKISPKIGPFEHSALIIECDDDQDGGYVLIDPRSNPENRIFAIPYHSTKEFPGFSITAKGKRSPNPLTQKNDKEEYEYWVTIANGGDLVLKRYILWSLSFIPIVTYNPDGSPRKLIKILPNEKKIELIDKENPNEKVSIPFNVIPHRSIHTLLERFMGRDFQLSSSTVHEELIAFATRYERTTALFNQVDKSII